MLVSIRDIEVTGNREDFSPAFPSLQYDPTCATPYSWGKAKADNRLSTYKEHIESRTPTVCIQSSPRQVKGQSVACSHSSIVVTRTHSR